MLDWLPAVLLFGLLFAVFGVMHLWTGDAPTGSCDGSGNCGDCNGPCHDPCEREEA